MTHLIGRGETEETGGGEAEEVEDATCLQGPQK